MSELRELNNVSLPFALDKKGNYIYIKDADRETKYYCPCCNKEVNTIAINDDIDYIMPPHYRHYPNQSCSGESLAHWVYKMWLFDKGSQFYVSNGLKKDLHIVKSINIENTYTTDYGGYRPDLTITTTYDKIFYFELNFSNPKRSNDYFCKWSQLNNDVIEVDVKKLLKESLNNKIPTFRLIYSEGICFDDKYNKRDTFAGIANKLHIRKEEIKRQDMLNYKIIWEKLDWFFDSIKMYKAMKSTMDDVLNSFRDVPFEEKEYCFEIIRKITCINNNDDFRNVMNDEFFEEFLKLEPMYNEKLKGLAYVEIKKCSYYKRDFKINLKTANNINILNIISCKFNETITWTKRHYPYSLYKEIKDKVDKFTADILKHMYFVNKINTYININYSEDEVKYLKNYSNYYKENIYNCLVTNEDMYNKIVKIFDNLIAKIRFDKKEKEISCIVEKVNDQIYNNQKPFSLSYSHKKCKNSSVERLVLYYDLSGVDIELSKHSHDSKFKSIFNNMNEDEIFDYINNKFNSYYKKNSDNITSKRILDIVYELKSLVNKNKWSLSVKHIDLNHTKINIEFNVYHSKPYYGNHKNILYHNERCVYSPDKVINIIDNKIDKVDLIGISDDEISVLIKGLLHNQMLEILEKVNKFDGIGYNERFLSKEDLHEKTTTILHNEISTR